MSAALPIRDTSKADAVYGIFKHSKRARVAEERLAALEPPQHGVHETPSPQEK